MSKYKISAGAYELLYVKGDVDAWMAKVKAAGGTGVRFFAEAAWHVIYKKDSIVGPYVYEDGTFDLSIKDKRYWSRLRVLLRLFKKHRLVPHIVLFDHCSWKLKGFGRWFVPWMNNKQNTGGPLTPASLVYEKRYVRKVIDTVKSICPKYEFEVCNEYNWQGWKDEEGIKWHKEIVKVLLGKGVPKSSIITSVTYSLPLELHVALAKQVGVYAFHGAGARDGDIMWNVVEALRDKSDAEVELSGDGYYKGKGWPDIKGKRGCDASEMKHIAKEMKIRGVTKYDFKDRGISGPGTESTLTDCGVISDVDLAHLEPLEAMAKELG